MMPSFHLQQPHWLWLALPLLLACCVRRTSRTPLLCGLPTVAAWPVAPRLRWLWVPRWSMALAGCCLLFALSRPVLVRPLPPQRLGVDWMLCLDTSSSMRQADLGDGQQRFAASQGFARELSRLRPLDRIGVVAFARYADLITPPSLDQRAVEQLLAELPLVAADGPEDATGFGAGLALAAKVLERSTAASKRIVLLSDGEENVASALAPREIAPQQAAAWCKAAGIAVLAVVMGNAAKLDTTALREVAALTGGAMYAAPEQHTLLAVQREIANSVQTPLAEPQFEVREQFPLAVAAALVLALLAGLARQLGLEATCSA